MKREEYIKTQLSILKIGQETAKLDLDTFLKMLNNSLNVGHIIDPTLYRKAQNNVQAIKKLAEALLSVQVQYQKCFETLLETQVKEFNERHGENIPNEG